MSAATEGLAARLQATLGDQVRAHAPSGELTTYRCGGPIAVLVRAGTRRDLEVIAAALAEGPAVDVLVVGRGSNLLVSDRGFDGLAVVLTGEFETVEVDASAATVSAGGAAPLPVLARRAAKEGVAGLEFYVGIPGSVGGAIRMNAGGHGEETRAVVQSVEIVDLADGGVRTPGIDQLALGYRTSALRPTDVVVRATFAGNPGDPAECGAKIDEIVRWRREHQPGGQNAGSVFTNPEGDAAGRLIEAAGCKGLRIGGAVVSEKHANFFVADPGARADDVYALVEEVQRRVETATGVRLVPELRFVGFADAGELTEVRER